MRNLVFTSLFLISSFSLIHAQILLSEDFEAGSLPAGWEIETNATDDGWIVGTEAGISSQYWNVPDNGSLYVIATNDDACNCDKSEDYLILPVLDFSDLDAIALRFDTYFEGGSYQGVDEVATVEASLNGTDWVVLEELHGHASWDEHTVDLSDYAGQETVYVAFHYNDGGDWLYGFALDNIAVIEPPALDGGLAELDYSPFGEENTAFPIGGIIHNEGATTITEMNISYSVNGGTPVLEVLAGLNIEPFEHYSFGLVNPWLPDASGIYEIEVEINMVNGSVDDNPDNNTAMFLTEIYPKVIPPNRIDDLLASDPVANIVATSANQLDKPNDLEFFPIMARDELWIVNERTENSGGSTLTIYGANEDSPDYEQRVDGNAWHFMSLPTGIAFGNNFNWATSPGVQDANHNGGTFTGPTLWSSDPDIYAQPSGGNGSHLDMLHGSPYSMGIAHEIDNAYWVFDGWNETIVRYDFVDDHGPGNDDHSDAIVRRYLEIEVKRDGDVPSHMVLDKTTGWLYVVDNGNDRVLRLDINSGNVAGPLPLINEPLAEHSEMENVDWEVILDGLDRPCGIEIMENRLLVGEYETGEIIVLDLDNDFEELGRIQTNNAGLTGLKIGPLGNLWYANKLLNQIVKLEASEPSSVDRAEFMQELSLYPNPAKESVFVGLPANFSGNNLELTIETIQGEVLMSGRVSNDNSELDLTSYPKGVYMISIRSEGGLAIGRLIIQ